MSGARLSAVAVDGPSRWRGVLPEELAERIGEIYAAAVALAWAARPLASDRTARAYAAAVGVEARAAHWLTLPTIAQQGHVMRAADATARALGLSWRSERRG